MNKGGDWNSLVTNLQIFNDANLLKKMSNRNRNNAKLILLMITFVQNLRHHDIAALIGYYGIGMVQDWKLFSEMVIYSC